MYYDKREYRLDGFEKSRTKGKMYDGILHNIKTGRKTRVPFGDSTMENYGDKTGLNLYPKLIHSDEKRRTAFHSRARGFVRDGFYSPGFFSLTLLW